MQDMRKVGEVGMKQIIRIDALEGGGLFYKGTFDSLGDAVIDAMQEMDEHSESFKAEDEYYRLEPMFRMDGDAAYCIQVHYKSRHWDKEVVEQFYFIEGESQEGR